MKAKLIKKPWERLTHMPAGLTLDTIYTATEISPTCLRILDDDNLIIYLDKTSFEIIEQDIITPAVYKHFKHSETGILNNYMYVTIGIAETIDVIDAHTKNLTNIGLYTETETKHTIRIVSDEQNKLYIPLKNHIISDGKYVIYKSLYDDKSYARSLEMFAGLVDKIKYPNMKQNFRFELMRY